MATNQVFKYTAVLLVLLMPMTCGFLFTKKTPQQGQNWMGQGPGSFQQGPNMMGQGPGSFQQGPNMMGPGPGSFQNGPNMKGPGPGSFQNGPNMMGPGPVSNRQGLGSYPPGQRPNSPGPYFAQGPYRQGPYQMGPNMYQAWPGPHSLPPRRPLQPPKRSFFSSIGRVFSSLFRFGNLFIPAAPKS